MENQLSWRQFAEKYPSFVYERFDIVRQGGNLHLTFTFGLPGAHTFTPTLTIPVPDESRFATLDPSIIDNLVFHIGLIEMLSYWKLTVSPTIHIACGTLAETQIAFLRNLIVNGMGEYIYKNHIAVAAIENLTITSQGSTFARFDGALQDRVLVPIGGGKDSVVTAMLLQEAGTTMNGFLLNPSKAASQTANVVGFQEPIVVSRTLDATMLLLNDQGFLNGHTPFSALLGFISVLAAVLNDYRYIALSNERSADEGNITYQGQVINHQYAKTFAFEQALHTYIQQFVAKEAWYFSFLRPLYEIQIAKIFSTYEQFFPVFLSCNVGQKSNTWCGTCSKCLFVFLLLYPFVGRDRLMVIFGRDLYADASLQSILAALLGVGEHKPFECVGTFREVQAACFMALAHKSKTQVLVTYYQNEVVPHHPMSDDVVSELLAGYASDTLVPDQFASIVQKVSKAI